ncbi:YdaU family protein [Acidithiobacillus caldus]|jgi:uncharacterized protein YdaU (DUF1376 family)|uniref:YdaU family protein n=1 Tax=Acidithiobacillus caldus TaxID=33059 RepID=UPI001C06C9FD|nr:YdaU family protein [Acidithiobacillus caldus]MBU2783609.1 YdaU family protein [Acidithiobacillus caldus]
MTAANAKMFWYKFFIQDYQRDTAHLTLLEHGAYRLLIDQCYLSGGLLPSDLEAIYRLARAMTKPEQAAIRTVLGAFFTRTDEGYLHGRVSREIEEMHQLGSVSRMNGAKGGRPKKNPAGSDTSQEKEPGKNPAGFESETQRVSETEPRRNPAGFENETQQVPKTKPRKNLSQESGVRSQNNLTLPRKARERVEAFPISATWHPSPTFWPMARHVGIFEDSDEYGPALADFLGFWRDRPGESRTQAGWEKAFLESWQRYRAFSGAKRETKQNGRAKLSPHSGFAERDYTVGVNPDGSF